MAAQEEQAQGVVVTRGSLAVRAGLRSIRLRRLHRGKVLAAAPRLLAARLVDESARRDLDQPRLRTLRYAGVGPLARRREKRLLNRILGGVEIAMASQHSAEDPRRELAQQALDGGVRVWLHISSGGALITWRTSNGVLMGAPPRPGAAEACAAISIARSRLSTSRIQ
jgi:hypothetical protein